MKIAIASDHGAFEAKEKLKQYLMQEGHVVDDFGCRSEESVDYPDLAQLAVSALLNKSAERAILLCGTGIGMSIAANKISGVRCALCSEPLSAKLTREHNDSNVLAMGARMIGMEMMKEIVAVWLATPFSNASRHQKRIDKLSSFEIIK